MTFFPRGGSAHVTRSLARELDRAGWHVSVVSGSRSDLGPAGDARAFYAGLDPTVVDFTSALAAPDPVAFTGGPPMHPSFEDRPGAPDRVFASLDDEEFERQVETWSAALTEARAADADVLHLHHLTPVNEAAARVAPGVPVVGQLHGTELLMLEQIARGAPAGWEHADAWAERMAGWATACERLLVAPGGLDRAADLLPVEPELLVPTPNGFDPDLFSPRDIDRRAFWRHWLVTDPRGWHAGEGPGSARYDEEEIAPLVDGVTIVYVGRFTEVKRLPFLIEAFAEARRRFRRPAGLVLVGGHPGEWEGEHPADAARRCGVREVFLAGWHGHDELPEFFAAADAVVLASEREQFGQVLVEGGACGLPVLAAASIGPASIVRDGETGCLFAIDDRAALSNALVELVNDADERRRRGARAREDAVARFSWPAIAGAVGEVFAEASGRRWR